MEDGVRHLASTLRGHLKASSSANAAKDWRYLWFLLLVLPIIFYFCAAQIINALVKIQKTMLLKNMKKCVKVTKQLVEKNASAPLRQTVKKILERNEIEMADLEALRPYVLEGDVVTFRAKLRGGYLKYNKDEPSAGAVASSSDSEVEKSKKVGLAGNGK